MSRVQALADDQLDDSTDEVFESFAREGRDPIALYRVLANAPTFIGGFHEVGAAIRYGSSLDRAIVELVILRIAQLTGSVYEWNHHHGMAVKAGVSREKIDHLDTWAEHPEHYSLPERRVLTVADAIHAVAVTDEEFDGLRQHFTERQATEIVVLASHYESVARVIQALDVDLEPEYRSVD